MEPQRALVKPRAISPETGETFALDDAIEGWVERDARGIVFVSGGQGSGRTTAIRHLASVFSGKPHIHFVDHCESIPDTINAESIDDLLLITAINGSGPQTRATGHLLADYRLAKWSFDDLIEYLVKRWPDDCSSVVARLKTRSDGRAGILDGLDGDPGAWRIALDRMAADESVREPLDAVIDELMRLIGSPEKLAEWQDMNLALVIGESMSGEVPLFAFWADKIGHLSSLSGVRLRLAANSVVATRDGNGTLPPKLTKPLIHDIAHRLNENSIRRLHEIISQPDPELSHASAVGLLVAVDPCWRPESVRHLDLVGCVLDGIAWPGMDFSQVPLSLVSLVATDLHGADLSKTKIESACFDSANLSGANLTAVDASNASFQGASLTGAEVLCSCFAFARLDDARLDGANIERTVLLGANLQNASLRKATLQKADLKDATIDRADFSGAMLEQADLDELPLRKAIFDGAVFRGASMRGCDLEGMSFAEESDFEGACLMGAYLTGTSLRRARLGGADLRTAGLADVDLEGADLRGALLDGATFHLGSTRCGLVDSLLASEGTRTGFYTDEFEEQHYRAPEEIRKANLRFTDLRGASLESTDFYLVDLRGARYSERQRQHFERCGAILD